MSISPDDQAFSLFCEKASGLVHEPSADVEATISASSSFGGPSFDI